jgi:hypothetical protein
MSLEYWDARTEFLNLKKAERLYTTDSTSQEYFSAQNAAFEPIGDISFPKEIP